MALGTAVTTGTGTALLLIFARLQAGQWIWTDGFYLNGNQWFDAARTTVTLVGIIGLGGAAFLAYRKQLSTEASHLLEQSSHRLEEASALRNRYTTCAEQLGHDNPAIRLAGVYALASLADDWHTFGNHDERQVCIDLLCAYLRSDRASPTNHSTASAPRAASRQQIAGRKPLRLAPNPPRPPLADRQEQDVRNAIVTVIRDHTPTPRQSAVADEGKQAGLLLGTETPAAASSRGARTWSGCRFDLNGANLVGAILAGANLAGANLAGANLSRAYLTFANLTDAYLTGADLTGVIMAEADLTGAIMADADLTKAYLAFSNLTGVSLTRANLTGAIMVDADLTGASLTRANLTRANLTRANLADVTLELVRQAGYTLGRATLTDIFYSSPPKNWPDSIPLPPSRGLRQET